MVDGVRPAGLAVPEDAGTVVSVADADADSEADAIVDADAVAIGATGETFLLTAESTADAEEDEADDDTGAADEFVDEEDDAGPAATPEPIASGATDPPP